MKPTLTGDPKGSAMTPAYTVKKLTAIKDCAPEHGLGDTQETCCATEDP